MRVAIRPIDELTPVARLVAENMREFDRAELAALGGGSPVYAVRSSIQLSPDEAYTAQGVDGEPLAVLGCGNTVIGNVGMPWLMATDRVERYRREMIELGLRYVHHLRQRYALLQNMVHVDNAPSIRYLTAIGFEVADQVYTLPNGGKGRIFATKGY